MVTLLILHYYYFFLYFIKKEFEKCCSLRFLILDRIDTVEPDVVDHIKTSIL